MRYIEGVSESLALAAREWRSGEISGEILCLGNGPSLEAVDFSAVSIATMGINRSCRLHVSPFHTMHDHPTNWRAYSSSPPRSRESAYAGVLKPLHTERRFQRGQILFLFDPCNRIVERFVCAKLGISYDSHSSGEYALIASAFLGFRRLWLIGYDCRDDEGHAPSLLAEGDKNFAINRESMGHARHFEQVAKVLKELSVEVINCNPASAIRCWPFAGV